MQKETPRILELHLDGKFSFRDIAGIIKEEFGTELTTENIRGRLRKIAKKMNYNNPSEIRGKGNDLFSGWMKDHGFDEPHTWDHGWLKVDNASIHIKNKDNVVSIDEVKADILEYIKDLAPKTPKLKREKVEEPHLLVIDPADVHIGKLALEDETDNEYNIKIAVQRCLDGVDGILKKANGFNIDKILLVIGNDILHTDSPHRKTTAGTPQDTDGMWWSAYIEAQKMYVKIINKLCGYADVHVIHNPSNHDYTHGTFLANSIECLFRHDKNVTFDTKIKHRKYFKYGNSLIGTTHGDGAKENDLPMLMANEVPELWASTQYRVWYTHHIHHKKKTKYTDGKDYIGATVEYLRSPSGTDGWHHRNGYTSMKAIEGFIHSKEFGQVSRFTHYFGK